MMLHRRDLIGSGVKYEYGLSYCSFKNGECLNDNAIPSNDSYSGISIDKHYPFYTDFINGQYFIPSGTNFFCLWDGEMLLDNGVTYTFSVKCDDSCLIRIENENVMRFVNNWTSTFTESYTSEKTGWHRFKFEIGQNSGGFGLSIANVSSNDGVFNSNRIGDASTSRWRTKTYGNDQFRTVDISGVTNISNYSGRLSSKFVNANNLLSISNYGLAGVCIDSDFPVLNTFSGGYQFFGTKFISNATFNVLTTFDNEYTFGASEGKKLYFPAIQTIPNRSFMGSKFDRLDFGNGLQSIGESAFENYVFANTDYKTIDIEEIVFRSTTPPTVNNINVDINSFRTNNVRRIYVPDSSISDYETTWNVHGKILPLSSLT